MESITFELCTAEGDPYDRTLGVMAKSGPTMVLCRSLRISPAVRFGQVLSEIDRLALAWALPQITDSEHLHDVWDEVDGRIGYGPFDPPIGPTQ